MALNLDKINPKRTRSPITHIQTQASTRDRTTRQDNIKVQTEENKWVLREVLNDEKWASDELREGAGSREVGQIQKARGPKALSFVRGTRRARGSETERRFRVGV